jgi:hypothetical protein
MCSATSPVPLLEMYHEQLRRTLNLQAEAVELHLAVGLHRRTPLPTTAVDHLPELSAVSTRPRDSPTSDRVEAEVAFSKYQRLPGQGVEVMLWMDVPNTFPWRKCLREYAGNIITYTCNLTVFCYTVHM